MKILLVEDERNLGLEISNFLEREGYILEHAWNWPSASEKIFVNTYDCILLDLGLPGGEGLDLLAQLKATPGRMDAVIILTARGDIDDRVAGLEAGADDYLPKPFSLTELLARIHAVIRRKHQLERNEVILHDFILDIKNHQLTCRSERINLTHKEFEIFNFLVLNKNKVISRSNLTEHVWGDILEINSDSNFVDVHVKNLRRKLSVHAPIHWFETVRSVGYRINA